MGLNAAQLLKTLGAGIIPGGSPQTKATENPTFDFANLLQKAERGELSSGQSITVNDSVDVEFSPEQLTRLSQAADSADVAGASKLFAIIDGVGVVVDIASRTIEHAAAIDGSSGDKVLPADVLVGVDAVAVVPEEDPSGVELDQPAQRLSSRRAANLGAPGRIENQSLLSRLASLYGEAADTHSF